jgi:hypothetical protein
MKPEFECAVTASFLRSGRVLSNCSNSAALIAAAGVFLAHAFAERLVFAASLLCWPVACYFGLRVAIDASVFRELAQQTADGGQALDALLRTWGLASKKPPDRTIAERSRGALKLWKRLIAVAAVQLATLAAGIMIQAWVR